MADAVSWCRDRLTPVESLLYQSSLVKVGRFQCGVDDPCFARTESLDNDVFVFPRNPLWFRRGSGQYRFAEPGGVLMHRAGGTIERQRASDHGDNAYWFGVRPDVFIETLQRHGLSISKMGDALVADSRLRSRVLMLMQQIETDVTPRLDIEEQVLALFFDFCLQRSDHHDPSEPTRTHTAARRRRIVNDARAFVNAHLADDVSLDTIARASGTSLYHLCRVFRDQTGMTLHTYRMRQRVGHALDRLAAGHDDSLTELAYSAGFSSHSHLSRVFRSQLGMPPSRFRAVAARR